MRTPPTSIVAAAGLVAGYGVAAGSGVRWLGGIVLLAAGLWCGLRWLRDIGRLRAVLLGLLFAGAFVVSHPLGHAIGSWPAVLTVSAITGLVCWVVADRPLR